MTRALVGVMLIVGFGAVTFGWRSWDQKRRTGDTGLRLGPPADPAGRFAHLLVAASFVASFVGPVVSLALADAAAPWGVRGLIDGRLGTPTLVIGVALALLGGIGTVTAQIQMGESWRVGVDASERTDLVTHGLFARVRNPIFTCMIVGLVGIALVTPNAISICAVVAACAGCAVQVRVVEEPYLVAVHGEPYERWAATSGRFLPGLGRLSRSD